MWSVWEAYICFIEIKIEGAPMGDAIEHALNCFFFECNFRRHWALGVEKWHISSSDKDIDNFEFFTLIDPPLKSQSTGNLHKFILFPIHLLISSIPSGKLTLLWKITILNRYSKSCAIFNSYVTVNFQRVYGINNLPRNGLKSCSSNSVTKRSDRKEFCLVCLRQSMMIGGVCHKHLRPH